MRICHLTTSTFDGTYFSSLAELLPELGAEQFFVKIGDKTLPSWATSKTLQSELDFRYLPYRTRAGYLINAYELSSFIKSNDIDILQTHMFDAAFVGAIAKKINKRIKFILTRHHLDDSYLLGNKLHLSVEKWSNKTADLVIVPSQATKDFMFDVEKQKTAKVRVIPYGFDFAKISASAEDRIKIRKEFEFDDKFVVGCVGRFFPNKGHKFLFKAISELIDKYPNLLIFLLGSGNRDILDKYLNEYKIADKVVFAGYRNDVPKCMKAMDILVHPSLSESFGQVIVEAMAVGTPVIATTVGGVPEIVENESTGLLLPPANVSSLTEALEKMLVNDDLRKKLGLQGQKSVIKKFNIGTFINSQLDSYKEILDETSKK